MNFRGIYLVFGVLLGAATLSEAQTVAELEEIYSRIEFDTRVLDGVKYSWPIHDQAAIRDVLLRVMNNASTFSPGLNALRSEIDQWTRSVDADEVTLLCRKRWYDDEVEMLVFADHRRNTADTLHDYVLIRETLGEETYDMLKGFKDVGQFESPQGRRYDIFLHALDPQMTLWSTTPTVNPTNPKEFVGEWYGLSAFGRLGNDRLNLPFWFRGTMVGGLRLTYVEDLARMPSRDYHKYTLALGWEEPIFFSVNIRPPMTSTTQLFKERRTEGSGSAVFMQATFVPSRRLGLLSSNEKEYLQLRAELSVALQEKLMFSARLPETFYSIRNYVSIAAEQRHVGGVFDLGLGLSWHDLHRFARVAYPDGRAARIEPTSKHFLPFLKVGIAEDGGLLQYDISTEVNYDVNEGFGFFVVRSLFMLGNIFGIDFKYFKSIRPSQLPPWHYEDYIIFSPVIRINF